MILLYKLLSWISPQISTDGREIFLLNSAPPYICLTLFPKLSLEVLSTPGETLLGVILYCSGRWRRCTPWQKYLLSAKISSRIEDNLCLDLQPSFGPSWNSLACLGVGPALGDGRGNVTLLILLGNIVAFDAIRCGDLLDHLSRLGHAGTILWLFQSYLEVMFQSVVLGGGLLLGPLASGLTGPASFHFALPPYTHFLNIKL